MSSPFERRRCLIPTVSASMLAATGISPPGCGGGGSDSDGPEPGFLYGVARGDPLADRVILWTHAKLAGNDNMVELEWEVAADNSFAAPLSRGAASATRDTGFTVKVDATGLQSGTDCFFRFRPGGRPHAHLAHRGV